MDGWMEHEEEVGSVRGLQGASLAPLLPLSECLCVFERQRVLCEIFLLLCYRRVVLRRVSQCGS